MNIKTIIFGLLVLQIFLIVDPSSIPSEKSLKREKRGLLSLMWHDSKIKTTWECVSNKIKSFFEQFTNKHHAEVVISRIHKKHIDIFANRSKLMIKPKPNFESILRKKRGVAMSFDEFMDKMMISFTQITQRTLLKNDKKTEIALAEISKEISLKYNNKTEIQSRETRAIRKRRAFPAIAIFAAKLIAWTASTAAVGVGVVMYDRATMETVLKKTCTIRL